MFENTPAFSGFSVDDIPAAQHFYGDTLGINLTEQSGMLQLHLAGGRDTFVYPKEDHVPATYTILNFEVDDIDAAVDALTERGVEMLHYDGSPQDSKGVLRGRSLGLGPDIAWFSDPAGNVLSVLHAD